MNTFSKILYFIGMFSLIVIGSFFTFCGGALVVNYINVPYQVLLGVIGIPFLVIGVFLLSIVLIKSLHYLYITYSSKELNKKTILMGLFYIFLGYIFFYINNYGDDTFILLFIGITFLIIGALSILVYIINISKSKSKKEKEVSNNPNL